MELETVAVVAVTVQGADLGDTTTLDVTLEEVSENLEAIKDRLRRKSSVEAKRPGRPPKREWLQHLIAEKGYHSAAVCGRLKRLYIQPVISEPKTGRRKWKGKRDQ